MLRTSDDLRRELTCFIEESERLIENAANLKAAAEEIRRKSKPTGVDMPATMPERLKRA